MNGPSISQISGLQTALTNAALGINSVKMGNLSIANPTNSTINLIIYAAYGLTITNFYQLSTNLGNITVTVNINGNPITGMTNIIVNTTPQNLTATNSNNMNIGDTLSIVLTNSNGASNLQGTLIATQH